MDLGNSCGGIFVATAHVGAQFHVISIFCLHCALHKIHRCKLFVYEKIFAQGKIISRRKSLGKEKKKPKEERKDTTLSSNEKKFLYESNLYQGSFTLASRFLTKKLLSNHNLPYMMLKTRFPFLHASTILDIKTSTITSNCNFESCMSICCLAPQLILQFFHFWHRFFLYLWQLCSLLCLPLQCSTEQSR